MSELAGWTIASDSRLMKPGGVLIIEIPARGGRRILDPFAGSGSFGVMAPPTPPLITLVSGYGEYELDVEEILRAKLPVFFDGLAATPLTPANIATIPAGAKGAYMLFHGDDPMPVYAGKTDADAGFQDRLKRHAWTVQGRKGLDASKMKFKAVRIMVFAALDVEALLIRRMKEEIPGSLRWNYSGFGSNDPGKRRDGQEPADFDQWFPVDVDYLVQNLPSGTVPLRKLLAATKLHLPFLLRYQMPPDVPVPGVPSSAPLRDIIQLVMGALPKGWQCTVLHGRVILYSACVNYDHHQEVFRN